jgi:hypothetical protein
VSSWGSMRGEGGEGDPNSRGREENVVVEGCGAGDGGKCDCLRDYGSGGVVGGGDIGSSTSQLCRAAAGVYSNAEDNVGVGYGGCGDGSDCDGG